MFQSYRLGLGEVLVAFRHIETIKPCVLGRTGVIEEQDVGFDACVGREDTAWETDDRMEIELRHQSPLDVCLDIGSEEESVRKDDCRSSILSETIYYEDDEQVGCLAATEIHREVVLDDILLGTTVGGFITITSNLSASS